MTVGQALLGFAAVAVVLTLVPGLDTTLVLRSALVNGRRTAAATALGVAAGLLVWGTAAALGAAALLAASRTAYLLVTLAGALYMAYLGVTLIVRSCRGGDHGAPASPPQQRVSTRRAFGTGAWTNVLNPKIGVFSIAMIPQFIPVGTSPLGMGLLLALVHVSLTLTWFALVILGAGAARRWLANARALRVVDRVAGTVMIGFGARLALAQR